MLTFGYLFRELESREGHRAEETHEKSLLGLQQKQQRHGVPTRQAGVYVA